MNQRRTQCRQGFGESAQLRAVRRNKSQCGATHRSHALLRVARVLKLAAKPDHIRPDPQRLQMTMQRSDVPFDTPECSQAEIPREVNDPLLRVTGG